MSSPEHRRRALLREVNERIFGLSLHFGSRRESTRLLCECGRGDCDKRIEVPLQVFDDVRAEDGRYVIHADHEEAPHLRGAAPLPAV